MRRRLNLIFICCFALLSGALAQSWQYVVMCDSRGTGAEPTSPDQINGPILTEIADAIAAENIDLVIVPGDLVQTGYEEALQLWKDTMAPVYNAGIPVYPVMGNHEKDGEDAPFINKFAADIPDNGPVGMTDLAYYVEHNNALFIGLDDKWMDQAWVDQTIAQSSATHIFPFGHQPMFKVSHADCYDDMPAVRDAFWTSFVSAGGKVYFCGHDHFLDVLRADDGDGHINNDAYQYLVGTAGAPLTSAWEYNGNNGSWTPTNEVHKKVYGYSVVTVDGSAVTIDFKERTATDTFTVTHTLSYDLELAAVPDDYSVEGDSTLIQPAPGVLANDTTPTQNPLTATLVSGPTSGTLNYLNADGSFQYTPNPGFLGTDSFVYEVDDGVDVDTASVTLTVSVVNELLLTADNVNSDPSGYGGSVEKTLNDPFAYDPDNPTSPLPVQNFSAATGRPGYHGAETDGVATVAYTLTDGPIMIDGNTLVVDLYGRDGYKDRDDDISIELYNGSTLVASSTGNAIAGTYNHGRVELQPIGTFDRLVVQGYHNSFTLMEIRAAVISTTTGNQAPAFSTDPINKANGTENAAYNGSIVGDASDPESDPMTFSKVSGPVWLSVASDGTLSGTPGAGDVGANVFTVQVDATGGSDTATLNITVNAAPAGGIKLINNIVANVGSSWQTITLPQSYNSMVVVATVVLESTSDSVAVARVQNAAGNSFDLRVQNPAGAALSGYTVHYMVVEEGTYTVAADGVKMEAVKYTSTLTDAMGSWVGESRVYANSYTSPVVLGQVMTQNDAAWSVFWCSNGTQANPPSASTLFAGKHVGEDSNKTRANETIGYIVVESGSGTMDGIDFVASLGSDTVEGVGDAPPYAYSFSLTDAQVAILAIAGQDGGDGGHANLFGSAPLSDTSLALVIDEDTLLDSERTHTTEQVGYVVFAAPAGPNSPPAFSADPINKANGTENAAYNGSIAGDASDPESDPMTFSKVSGPAWLSVASNGGLSGTPGAGDVGANAFTVQVDATGGSDTATLNITVVIAPPTTVGDIATSMDGGSMIINWIGEEGGTYAVQTTTNLTAGAWSNVVEGLTGVGMINVTNDATETKAFFRVILQ